MICNHDDFINLKCPKDLPQVKMVPQHCKAAKKTEVEGAICLNL